MIGLSRSLFMVERHLQQISQCVWKRQLISTAKKPGFTFLPAQAVNLNRVDAKRYTATLKGQKKRKSAKRIEFEAMIQQRITAAKKAEHTKQKAEGMCQEDHRKIAGDLFLQLKDSQPFQSHGDALEPTLQAFVGCLTTSQLFQHSDILWLLNTQPTLLQTDMDILKKQVAFLTDFGFTNQQVMAILGEAGPAVLDKSTSDLDRTMSWLLELGIVDGVFQRVVSSCPQVLLLPQAQLSSVVRVLMDCEFNRDQVVQIISTSPNVFTFNPQYLNFVFCYVCLDMGITDRQEILRAKLFRHSFEEVKRRHRFLEMLGLYKKLDKKGRTYVENPPLYKIINSSLQHFLEHVAMATAEDYEIFKQNERLAEEEGLESEGSDSDTYEYDYYSDDTDDYDSDDTGDSNSDLDAAYDSEKEDN